MILDRLYTNEDFTPEFITLKMTQWANDPFLWMVEQVFTIDESDRGSPLKRFPPYAYIKHLIDEYFKTAHLSP